jgi:predicted MFS family arabinose efflux permease
MEPSSVDRPLAIAAAAVLSSVGVLLFNTMPAVVGGAGDALALPNAKLGLPPMAYMLGHTVAAISVIFWVRRVAWRRAAAIALLLLGGGLIAGAFAHDLRTLLGTMFVTGLGGGAVFGIAMTALGDTRNPDRSYGLGNIAQVVIPAAVLWLLPGVVVPRWGFVGMLLVLAALTLAGALMVPWMANCGRVAESAGARAKGWQPLVLTMLVGFGFFVLGDVAVWAFFERIGEAAQVSDAAIGRVLAVSLLAAGVGSLVPVFLGDRFGRLSFVLGCVFVQILCLAALGSESGRGAYALIVPVFMFCWTVAVIYQVAAIAAHDATGRYTPAIPAVLGVGSAAGPALGGVFVRDGDFRPMYLMTAVALLVAVALATWATRQVAREAVATGGGST